MTSFLKETVAPINRRFQSDNSHPVDQARITAKEWGEIKKVLSLSYHSGINMSDEQSRMCEMIPHRAYQMYSGQPPEFVENAFSMYSHDRFTKLILSGIVCGLAQRKLTEDEIIEVLQSKQVRWMLDGDEDELFKFGITLSEGLEKEE